MNLSRALLIVVAGILFTSCYKRDDDFNFPISLEIEDALIFKNNKNYIVGDTIFLELNFSRYLKEAGYSELLDIYVTTAAEQFLYDFDMEKFSIQSNEYRRLSIDSQFLLSEKGNLFPDANRAGAIFNQNTDMYESKVGIILAEEGRYILNMDFLYISSDEELDKVRVIIEHRFTDTDTERFAFSVSE